MVGANMSEGNTIHLSDYTDYRYGVFLANHGIGLSELMKDWPEAFQRTKT
jgi:hypothetical protein